MPPRSSPDNNPGPHGFTEVLYAYISQTGNNGSAFAGLSANTLWYNLTGAIAMVVGRYFDDHPDHGDCRLARRQEDRCRLLRHISDQGGLFVGLVVGVIVIIGGLIFFPALALGPIVEQLAINAGTLFSAN